MKWKNLATQTTTFFITASLKDWRPLFDHEPARRIMLDDFNYYRIKYGCRILAYVLMPEHYHLVVDFSKPEDLHGWLRDVQGHSATMLSGWLADSQMQPKETANEIWKEQARAFGIFSERTLRVKVDYIHNNPIKRGLCTVPEGWLWSSWRNYYCEDDSVFCVDKFDDLNLGT